MSGTGDPRRNQRSDAIARPIEPSLMQRLLSGARDILGFANHGDVAAALGATQPQPDRPIGSNQQMIAAAGSNQQASGSPYTGWFGPGAPLPPSAPAADVAGRAYDYPSTYNIGTRPRRYEGISFEQLEQLADSLDLLRLCIETRKDQFGNLTWGCLPRARTTEEADLRGKPDARCQKFEDFMRRPDRKQAFGMWARELIESQLVFDAPALYVHRDLGGEVYALEVVKGSTVSVLLDKKGRAPEPPNAAYQQILKGLPAIDYTTEELLYWPRNRRPGHPYGMSPVQQVIMTVNIALRREMQKLQLFTEGNVPEALCSVPESWSPDQIARFQAMWDAMLADQSERRRMKFVPGGMNFQMTRDDAALSGDAAADEWLARVICYAFSLPPLAFVRMMNRGTSETAQQTAEEEGLQPMMEWFKSLMDHIIQVIFGWDDLELVWDDIRKVDPAEQESRDIQLVQIGIKSIDEVRVKMGLPPLGIGNVIFGGPNGVMFVDDLIKAQKQGLLMPGQQQAPVDATGGGMFGGAPQAMPRPGGPGGFAHPFSASAAAALGRLPPQLLAAVGLGAAGAKGRVVDVTHAEEASSDPLSNVVAHPAVLKTLREAERRQGRGVG